MGEATPLAGLSLKLGVAVVFLSSSTVWYRLLLVHTTAVRTRTVGSYMYVLPLLDLHVATILDRAVVKLLHYSP